MINKVIKQIKRVPKKITKHYRKRAWRTIPVAKVDSASHRAKEKILSDPLNGANRTTARAARKMYKENVSKALTKQVRREKLEDGIKATAVVGISGVAIAQKKRRKQ
jgi:hypothetical protein